MLSICQVNQIRDSLAIMGDNSTAFSLPQVGVCLVLLAFSINFFKPDPTYHFPLLCSLDLTNHLYNFNGT